MNNFDIKRLWNVAKWDLTINRQFYLKSSLIVCVVMALPTLSSILTCRDLTDVPWSEPAFVRAGITGENTWSMYILLLPFLFGYMFHNLTSRQGRINEFTLPATNPEKFLCHVCLILLGSLALAVASFVALDIVNYLATGLIAGFGNTGEFVHSMLRMHENYSIFDILRLDQKESLFCLLSYVLYLSTFVLGNAYKYKHNVLFTIVWDMALTFVALVFIFAFCTHYVYSFGMRSFLNLQTQGWFLVWYVILVAVTVLCWTLAYRLYTRAQLTSRRNR